MHTIAKSRTSTYNQYVILISAGVLPDLPFNFCNCLSTRWFSFQFHACQSLLRWTNGNSRSSHKHHSMPATTKGERPEDLLTPLAYALSLAPPRAPPFDSTHRALLAGKDPGLSRYHLQHRQRTLRMTECRNTSHPASVNHSNSIYNRLHRAHLQRCRHGTRQHPHLYEQKDWFTLWLDKHISVPTWNKLRDSGSFRAVADMLVLLGIPAMAVASPRAALQFISLSRQVQTISYGPHVMPNIDLFPRKNSRELVVFVHGGAWGSGMPWMYRMVARGFKENVAVVGYRTYPDADVPGQVQDLSLALEKLRTRFSAINQFTLIRSEEHTSEPSHVD